MRPAPLPYLSMTRAEFRERNDGCEYHNGWFANIGDRVIDRDGFKGVVTKLNEDGEAFVAWNIGGTTVISLSDLDLAS